MTKSDNRIIRPRDIKTGRFAAKWRVEIAWHEWRLSDCPYGCKIYHNTITGQLKLMHNSNYGCPQG